MYLLDTNVVSELRRTRARMARFWLGCAGWSMAPGPYDHVYLFPHCAINKLGFGGHENAPAR
jgi:hypothetical protein